MPCKACIERGKPENFASEPRCAFKNGVFCSENWNCATANAIRSMMDEGAENAFRIRRYDQSYGVIWIPPHPEDLPEGDRIGPWRGGGFIAGYWYKERGRTDMLIRVDPRDGGLPEESGLPLLLNEAEAAIENWALFHRFDSLTAKR